MFNDYKVVPLFASEVGANNSNNKGLSKIYRMTCIGLETNKQNGSSSTLYHLPKPYAVLSYAFADVGRSGRC